jgi:hypothetical protein
MLHKSFQEMGIPPGYGFQQLLFSRVINTLVVQTRSRDHNWRPERLYLRKATSDTYRSIGAPGDLTSQEFPFVHPSKPLLAYNSMQHSFTLDAEGKERLGGDWDSLKVFDLESETEIASVNRDTLHLPNGFVTGWISSIVGFCDAGLFVKAGLSEDRSRLDYFVAEVDFAQRTLRPIVALPAVFM